MAHRLDLLTQTILNKSLEDCSEEELQNLANRYPYFAPSQFLYLKKLSPDSAAYQKQYQRAALYYKDPVFFNQFLLEDINDLDLLPTSVSIEPKAIPEKEHTPIIVTESERVEDTLTLPPPKAEAPVADNVISFEPFHTVDYFASQGIKLSLEDASKDKFGKQVKSFTEWLKTMKRLPATQLQNIQGPAEKQVENMAAHSVQTSDVVTEAMAEVWVHQGNKAKAKEVYRKLSLLNPSKSAYFASKIELLNDSN